LQKGAKNPKNLVAKAFYAFEKKVFVPPFFKKVVGCGVKPHGLDFSQCKNLECPRSIRGFFSRLIRSCAYLAKIKEIKGVHMFAVNTKLEVQTFAFSNFQQSGIPCSANDLPCANRHTNLDAVRHNC